MRALLAAALLLAGCSSSGDSSHDDPADLLATRDGSSDFATYRAALDAWQAKCRQDRVTVAGYVDGTYSDERKHDGPDSSRLEVMRNLTRSVPDAMAPTDCQSTAAGYLILVEHGS